MLLSIRGPEWLWVHRQRGEGWRCSQIPPARSWHVSPVPGEQLSSVASPHGSQPGWCITERFVLGILTAPPQILSCNRASHRHCGCCHQVHLPLLLGAAGWGSRPLIPALPTNHPGASSSVVTRAHSVF